jgi:dienelactone hydrolase
MRGRTAGVALALALSATPAAAAAADATPYLPTPTGHRPVGSISLYLKDTSRADPWVPSVTYRELMVSVFYPAASANGPKAQYVTPAESAAMLTGSGIEAPPDTLSKTRTSSLAEARPAGRDLPLVVLSPGYLRPRATLTALAEDLASHGYAVALIGHTYENVATSFPDGRTVGCASCAMEHDTAFWQKLEAGRATDVSFVLNELTHSKWATLIDPNRIGMAGHSAGGASVLSAMVADSRIKGGIDIDGAIARPLTPPELSRPFMFMSHQLDPATRCAPLRTDWEQDWAQMTGWKRWIEVAGTVHPSFTDVGLFADQYGVDLGATTTAERTQAITRTYVNAFFDRHLRDRPSSLLDRPSPRYPEVARCH